MFSHNSHFNNFKNINEEKIIISLTIDIINLINIINIRIIIIIK